MIQLFYILLLILFSSDIYATRSIHRKSDQTIPYITVSTSNRLIEQESEKPNKKIKCHKFQSQYLRKKTLKKPYENSGFKKHMLPSGNIKFRKSEKAVSSTTLKDLNEQIFQEIENGAKTFTHFSVLKDRDFNYATHSGLLILKYNDYPFVLKLSIEYPETFTNPLSRGIQASCIFILSGNTRHLSGFTRIQNMENAKKALSKDPEYRYYLDFPRKWYWLPKDQNFLHIQWHDDYNKHIETINIPSVYGVVCDFIETDKKVQHQEMHTLRQISIDVASYLRYTIDPHADNLVPEANSNKIVIIDTEHFPTVVGLDKEMNANGYIKWYLELAGKCFSTIIFRPKQKRIFDQRKV